MSNDDSASSGRGRGGLGQGLPSFSALSEVFGAAVDGASRMTRTRAKQLAERLLNQAGLENVDLGEAASEAGARINQLTEEILSARKANRALLQRTITNELEKSLQRLGLARAEDLQQLRDEVTRLRTEVAGLRSGAATETTVGKKTAAGRRAPAAKTATGPTAQQPPARSSATRKTPAKSAPTTGAATKSAATKSAATKSPSTRNAATKKTTGGTARKTASSRTTGQANGGSNA